MKKLLRYITLIGLALLFACSDNNGIEPVPGRLDLEVKFWEEGIPDNTEGIYLFVAPEFPPHAINEMFLSPNSLPLTGETTVQTSIDLPYGHYEAIGLWWYNKSTESNLADLFTLKIESYINDQNQLEFRPFEFDLTPEEPVLQTDLRADLNRVDRDASVQGTINFNDDFPANTLATAIGAYSRVPVRPIDYLIYLKSMDYSIDENPFQFNLPVNSQVDIAFLGVFWLSDRSGLDDFKTLGFYEDPDNPGQPMSIHLTPNTDVTGINIDADWSIINE